MAGAKPVLYPRLTSKPAPLQTSPELRFCDFTSGGQLFLWSARQWMLGHRRGGSVAAELDGAYKRFNCLPAVCHLHRIMELLCAAPGWSVELNHPLFPTVSHYERALLRLLQCANLPDESSSAFAAAKLLVLDERAELCGAARRYGVALQVAGMGLSNYRQLKLVWSASP